MNCLRIFDIVYDTDNESVDDLIGVVTSLADDNPDWLDENNEIIEENVSDWLSDQTGWLVETFSWEFKSITDFPKNTWISETCESVVINKDLYNEINYKDREAFKIKHEAEIAELMEIMNIEEKCAICSLAARKGVTKAFRWFD